MKLYPSHYKWKNWTISSKVIYISLIIIIVSVLLTITIYTINSSTNYTEINNTKFGLYDDLFVKLKKERNKLTTETFKELISYSNYLNTLKKEENIQLRSTLFVYLTSLNLNEDDYTLIFNNISFDNCVFENQIFKDICFPSFNNVTFSSCVFIKCNFNFNVIINSKIYNSSFFDCNFEHSMFKNCHFNNTEFCSCKLINSYILNCDLTKFEIWESNLSYSYFNGSNFNNDFKFDRIIVDNKWVERLNEKVYPFGVGGFPEVFDAVYNFPDLNSKEFTFQEKENGKIYIFHCDECISCSLEYDKYIEN